MKEGQRSRLGPNVVKIYDFADIGASEPFVARIMLELPRALEGTRLSDGQKRAAKEAILVIGAEGLMPALENLRAIRTIPDQPNLPEMNRRQKFGQFYNSLWFAYKDRFQCAVRALGFDLGFVFQEKTNFENRAKYFLQNNTQFEPAFIDFLRKQRDDWQNSLRLLRNDYLEHRKLQWRKVEKFYCAKQAEAVFEQNIAGKQWKLFLTHSSAPYSLQDLLSYKPT